MTFPLFARAKRLSPVFTRVNAGAFSFCVATLFAGCRASTEPTPTPPIRGRTFSVVSVGGRALPTTIGVSGKSSGCEQQPVTKITLEFRSDSSYVETFTNNATSFQMTSSFKEPLNGQLAVIAPSDTVVVTDGTLKVKRTGVICAREEFVAAPL